MNFLKSITKPTFVTNESIAKQNIAFMVNKANKNQVRFRPHFKTHQSKEIGEWYREAGVQYITVSSVTMANYFADAGWKDILIAFPVNPLELPEIILLSKRVKLGLLIDSETVLENLSEVMTTEVNLWIKIDTGYHRAGIVWDDYERILSLVQKILSSSNLKLEGILTHAGHTYHAQSTAEILKIFDQTRIRLINVKQRMQESFNVTPKISIGDTPGCKIASDFTNIDEIRPGNFVFYDVQQVALGVCAYAEIAVALACPVVSIYPDRNEALIYGGAIHLSKDFATMSDGTKTYGVVFKPDKDMKMIHNQGHLRSLSQEHGIIQMPLQKKDMLKPGEIVFVAPAHSCLTLQAMQDGYTYDGRQIKTMLSIH